MSCFLSRARILPVLCLRRGLSSASAAEAEALPPPRGGDGARGRHAARKRGGAHLGPPRVRLQRTSASPGTTRRRRGGRSSSFRPGLSPPCRAGRARLSSTRRSGPRAINLYRDL
uniref:Uncharacterized protein n=1 Tax=Arundo donax TaxID=35708 RepID=A0A0A9EDW9_ARUDO